jgi:hypothetical protein
MVTPRRCRRWPFLELKIDDAFLVEDVADFNTVKASRCQYMRRYPGLVWVTLTLRRRDGSKYMQVKRVR